METIEYTEPTAKYLMFYGNAETPCAEALFDTKDAAMMFASAWDSIDENHWARLNTYTWLVKVEK